MEKNNSDSLVYDASRQDPGDDAARDLERRLRHYETLEARGPLEGALGVGDYSAMVLLTLGLVVTFYLWGY
ncbi:hypothetical protein GCM10011348_29920 [Marinobacterium nitratireducens]|uniref:Uncharacterized protein n=1 Tax=Marinobacterium nitratireducens TaxID=518897 RepID=A0A918DUA1_9GAMM|nr:hypothetical protein [Marinobacterium nitratireducens]GGO84208.1 hypothetical protein GCM10011348_29920 [Marinobacterium nitratireducens]